MFVEWPLAENAIRAEELAAMAEQSGSQTIIGLQARIAPAILKLKSMLESGSLGQVLSSSVQASTPLGGGDSISEGLGYFLDRKVGGNPITIAFGHSECWCCVLISSALTTLIVIDFVHSVLGEYRTCSSHSQIQRPKQMIVNRDGGESRPFISDVPDLASVHGALVGSSFVAEGASLVSLQH